MRTCKVCGIEKEYNYLCLNGQGRAVYKDEHGKIWHGKTCSVCFTNYVKLKANKDPLKTLGCIICNAQFKQKVIQQVYCSKKCQKSSQKISV